MNTTMAMLNWLLGEDTGVSSRTIFAVMTGANIARSDLPYDPSDFGRCYRLLEQFPEWRERLPEVATRYLVWGPMVDNWTELTALYLEELPTGKAPRLYNRMQGLVAEGRALAKRVACTTQGAST